MHRLFTCFAIATVGLAVLASCTKTYPDGDQDYEFNEFVPIALTKAESGIASRANEFGFDVFHSVYEDKSVLISPLSLSLALSMTACGADGETEKQMTSTLGFNDYSATEVAGYYKKMVESLGEIDKKTTFEVANSIWISKFLNVKKEFLATVKDNFSSDEKTVDFNDPEVTGLINAWCSDKTHGKITEIVKSVPRETAMALVNALYFNGRWGGFKFDDKTSKENFKTVSGSRTKVQMMSASSNFPYASSEGWEMLDLNYGNCAFRMSVILPPENMKFSDAARSLDAARFQELSRCAESHPVNLKMPEFKCEYSIDELSDVLSGLGMEDAFDAGKADFSKMADLPVGYNLYIGTVKHKTFIDVNTKGTEAAAVTYVGMYLTAAMPEQPREPVDFIVDRPFFYVIRESSTGSILFIGQKTD